MKSGKQVNFRAILLFSLTLILYCCASFKTAYDESGINTLTGQVVFNRVSFRTYGDNKISYANRYHGGIFISAGSKCTIKDITKKSIKFTVLGTEYELVNWLMKTSNLSSKDVTLSFNKFFVKNKNEVGLDKINRDFLDNIISGIAEVGMNKKEILLSLGYPGYLGRKNPTIDDDRDFILLQDDWYYLRGRWAKALLKFRAGKLYLIIDWAR